MATPARRACSVPRWPAQIQLAPTQAGQVLVRAIYSGISRGTEWTVPMVPGLVRLIVVLITIFWPFTILAYLVLMLVVPEEPAAEKPAEIVETGDQLQ